MPEEQKTTIYSLKLHESIVTKNGLNGSMEITRVAGGWIYAFEYPGYRQSPMTFVPFDNEFMEVITSVSTTK